MSLASSDALTGRFADALQDALARADARMHLDIRELHLEVDRPLLDDRSALAALADSVARRILERTGQ